MIGNENANLVGVFQGVQQQLASNFQVKIDDGYETLVSKMVMRNAVYSGQWGKETTPYLNRMISILMDGIWDRKFMASHSVSGRKCPTDKSGKPPKPALPADPVNAITNFSVSFWRTQHGMNISSSTVLAAISAKLSSEHSAMLKGKLDKDGE